MAIDVPRQYVPLTCHGHSRPVPHIGFSNLEKEETYYLISACKGKRLALCYFSLLTVLDGNPMLRDGVTGDWLVDRFRVINQANKVGSAHSSATRELFGRRD